MADTVYLTGVSNPETVVLIGGTVQTTVNLTGTVGIAGPAGKDGADGADGSNSGGIWGQIAGTLASQTDLQTALDTKLVASSNLSDLPNPSTARANLGVAIGTKVESALPTGTVDQYLRGDKTMQDFNTAVRTNRLNQLTAPSASVNMSGQSLTNLATPSNSSDAATKSYVDAVAQGLAVKGPVVVASATALPTNTYSGGFITETSSGSITVDGVTLSVDDRVLVKNEAAASKNGIYTVTDTGSVSTPFILRRAADMDANNEVAGAYTFVTGGTANANTGWNVAGSGPFTLGTTAIAFNQFSSATIPDATTSVKGKLQLAGDLSGTASAPTVPALTTKAQFDAYYKQLAASPETIIAGTITRDANEAATSAPVVWPNGSVGTYTATTVSTAFPGAVDAYTITYGSPVTRTYTQSAVTRDTNGAVTTRPAITVTP